MNLFGKKEKKEEAPACVCNGNAEVKVNDAPVSDTKLTSVKVLGSGCKNCKALLDNTNTALQNMNAGFEAEYVTDMAVVAGYGVMSTPALVVNEKVVSMGKVMNPSEVENLLHKIGY